MICNHFHISVLAHYAARELLSYQRTQPAVIGAMLYAENVRSVNTIASEPTSTEGFQFDDRARFQRYSALQIIKAAHHLADQSSEPGYEGWETSEAKTILDGIIIEASHDLPGYSEQEGELQP